MSSLRFAYSTNGFTQRSLREALEIISRLGYHGVEILGDRPHWSATQGSELSTTELKTLLTDLDLSISNVNGNTAMYFWPEWIPETLFEPALSHVDPKVREQRIDGTIQLMHWAKELGAPRVSVTSGRCPGLASPELEHGYLVDSLQKLLVVANTLDLQLSIEYEPGLLIERWSELALLISEINHPRLGANLDLGHARCAGEEPLEAINGLKDRLWNIHIEDIKEQKHFHLIPGEGDMPLHHYLDKLKRIKYQEFITVELYTYACRDQDQDIQAATKALQYLQQIS